MPSDPTELIASLVDELRPVRAMRMRDGLALAGGAGAVTVIATIAVLGLRPDVANGQFQPLFLFANGLFLIVGLATGLAAVGMGMPRVGHSSQGWKWVVAMASLLPAAAVIMLASRTEPLPPVLVASNEMKCVAMGLALGLLTATVLVWWLRRGAPSSAERAGWLVGLSSGSTGLFAFALHCPFDSFYHVGLWHMLPVVIGGLLGRQIVPPLIRW